MIVSDGLTPKSVADFPHRRFDSRWGRRSVVSRLGGLPMLCLRPSRVALAAGAIVACVIFAGCDGGTPTSDVTSSSTGARTPEATAASSGTAAVDEITWLAGIVALGKKMVGPTGGEVTVTQEYLRAEAKRLASCSAELAQLGPATDRLEAALVLAQQACAKYEEGAKCYTAAGSDIEKSNECLEAVNEASRLFSVAESTAESLKGGG